MLAVLLAVCVAISQSPTPEPASGAIEGIVRDEAGGVLPGASVRAISASVRISAVSNATGQFRLEVPPGTYSLEVQMAGFVPALGSILKITVAVGQRAAWNPILVFPAARLSGPSLESLIRDAIGSTYVDCGHHGMASAPELQQSLECLNGARRAGRPAVSYSLVSGVDVNWTIGLLLDSRGQMTSFVYGPSQVFAPHPCPNPVIRADEIAPGITFGPSWFGCDTSSK
jgi:hypothetical protein